MKSNSIISVIVHGLILLSVQALLLVRFSFPVIDRYTLSAFIYPLIIMILPLRTPRSVVLFIAFFLGLGMDFFYDSPGVHAGALVFMAMARTLALRFMEPRGGYKTATLPTPANYGSQWFITYSGVLLLAFLLAYFTLDIFAISFFDKIVVNALVSFIASYALILLYQMLIRQ